MIQLSEHFRSDNRNRYSERMKHQQWFIKARHDQERKEEAADKLEAEFLTLATEVVMAAQIQIGEYKAKLVTYDEATVFALMENQEQLDAVRAEIQDMLSRAYVMNDGRRVFKSEDGILVIDEFGEIVTLEELNPDLVPFDGPTSDEYLSKLKLEDDLLAERQKIHEFDELKNQQHEELEEGGVTEERLEEMDAELFNAMPDSIRTHVPGLAAKENVTSVKTSFTAEARPTTLNIVTLATESLPAPNHDPMG